MEVTRGSKNDRSQRFSQKLWRGEGTQRD
jgi:hypothetical protein